jgi:predicted dehydrogenase
MPKLFRLALVGAGMVTRGSHLPAALASEKLQVVALVDPMTQRAKELARSYGITPHIVPRVQDALGEIDGAVIATPNDTHMSIALTCLEAGVATLIEKPLATTYAQGETIVNAGEKYGAVVAVGYVIRFRESILLLGDLLKAGYFGTMRRFAHQAGTRGGWAPMSSYNLSRQATGGGVLVVTGTHFLDCMLHFWGYPNEALLEDDAQGGPEANCMATFRYSNAQRQFEGVALYSKTTDLPRGIIIETDRGTVQIADTDDSDSITFRSHTDPQVEQVVRRTGKPPYPTTMNVFQRQLEDFADACQQGRAPTVGGAQGLLSLRLIEELYARRKPLNTHWYPETPAQVTS